MSKTIDKTFTLATPVKDMDGAPLDTLELRKPKAKDLRALDKVDGEIAGMYEIVSRCSGVPVSEIDEMELADLTPVIDWVSGFLPGGAASTAKS